MSTDLVSKYASKIAVALIVDGRKIYKIYTAFKTIRRLKRGK